MNMYGKASNMKVLVRDDLELGVFGILEFDENEVDLDTVKSKLFNGRGANEELYLCEKMKLLEKRYSSVRWEPNPTTIWY